MATTHTREIISINVINDGTNDVVSDVIFKFTSNNDSEVLNGPESERVTIRNFNVETEGVSNSSEGFVEFANLTQEIIEGWIGEEFVNFCSRIESENSNHFDFRISDITNPPAPRIVKRDRPW